MRVGRAPLDEEAIRLIEEYNPEVEFDWTRILKGQEDSPAPEVKPRGEHEPERRKHPRDVPPLSAPIPPVVIEPEAIPQPAIELTPPPTAAALEPETAALRRLGPEGLLRLRARHAEVMARISDRVDDEVRREQLKSEAERLNPDTWVTDDEVTAGLEQYESVFESLRSVVGRRRKRRKRRSGAAATTATGQPPAETNELDETDEDAGDSGPDETS